MKIGDRVIWTPDETWHFKSKFKAVITNIIPNIGIELRLFNGSYVINYVSECDLELDKEYYREEKLKRIINDNKRTT